jgi:hypothetical protein
MSPEPAVYSPIFTSRCLVAALTEDVPLPLGFRTVPGLSYKLLQANAHHNCAPAVTNVLLITSRLGPHRKQLSSVAVQLLLNSGITHFIFACASICTNCQENAIPLLLQRSRNLVTAVV